MALDQAGRHQIFDTEPMVMGHILIPEPRQGWTVTSDWGLETPGGAMHIIFREMGSPLELAMGHPPSEFGQVGHERSFNEKCITTEDNATITNQ